MAKAAQSRIKVCNVSDAALGGGYRGSGWTADITVSGERFVRQQRPTLVIAPDITDPQITGREALFPEAKPFRQSDGSLIGRLDIGLKTMKADLGKGVGYRLRTASVIKPRPAKVTMP